MAEKEKNVSYSMGHHGSRFSAVEHAENTSATLKRISGYFSSEKNLVFSLLLVVVFGTLCGILAPSLQSTAIDIIAGSTDGVFAKTVGLMFAVYVLYGVSQLLQGFISARLSQQIVKNMREQLFEKILRLPVKYLDTHSHGDVMSRMTNDIENISSTVSQALPSLFSGILTLIGTVSIMFYYCWQLALLSCGVMLLTIGATKYLSVRVRKYSKRQQALLGMINGTVEEMTRGYKTIVAYNRQDETVDNFCKTADKMRSAGIRTNIYSGVMWPVMNFISNIEFVVIAAFGGYFAVRGYISVGVISAFIVYTRRPGPAPLPPFTRRPWSSGESTRPCPRWALPRATSWSHPAAPAISWACSLRIWRAAKPMAWNWIPFPGGLRGSFTRTPAFP